MKATNLSIHILQKNILEHFDSNLNEPAVIFSDNCDICYPYAKTINLCFFGAALRDLLSSDQLPSTSKLKIWVLSQSMRSRIHFFYKIPLNCIGVLNRYELFAQQSSIPEIYIDTKQKIHFIYAARASKLKNFPLIVDVLAELEKKAIPFHFHICGPYFKEGSFRNIEQLNKSNYTFHGDLGPNWHKSQTVQDIKNKVLIHLPTDPFDDFCVSLAQWETLKQPAIIPNIGPYQNTKAQNHLRIPLKDLLDKQVNSIINAILSFSKGEDTFAEIPPPDPISKIELLKFQKNITQKQKDDFFKLNTYELSTTAMEILHVN